MNLYDADRSCVEFKSILANICGRVQDRDLSFINFIENFTYFESDLEKIASDLTKISSIASKGYAHIDFMGGVGFDSFYKSEILNKMLLIHQKDDDGIADIIMSPKRMIVHIDNDIMKSYIMLTSKQLAKTGEGIDEGGFEHIGKIIPSENEKNPDIYDVFYIYAENFPILIHPKGSVYSLDNQAKERLFLGYLNIA